jgi:hypothetical protein
MGLALRAQPSSLTAAWAAELRTRLHTGLTAPADKGVRAAFVLGAGVAGDAAAASPLDAVTGVTGSDDPSRLVASFDDFDRSNLELRAAVRALGGNGDAATVAALREIAADAARRYPDLTRGCVVLAIGRICGDFGPLDRATEDLELRAYVPALDELLLWL